GRDLCDAFRLVPPGSGGGFADAMLDVCRREGADVVLPQSSFDLPGLGAAKGRFREAGVAALVSSAEAIRRSNDKAESYAMLDAIGVPGPAWRRVRGPEAAAAAAGELGYPGRDGCLKPVVSPGARGV